MYKKKEYMNLSWSRPRESVIIINVHGARKKGSYFEYKTLENQWDKAYGNYKKLGRETKYNLSKEHI
jgi:hypothetical protein